MVTQWQEETHIHVLLVRGQDLIFVLLEHLSDGVQRDISLRDVDELRRLKGPSSRLGDPLRGVVGRRLRVRHVGAASW